MSSELLNLEDQSSLDLKITQKINSQQKFSSIDEINELSKLDGVKYPMIDSHVHITDFTQETPGLKDLIYYMDSSNIKKSVIFGMPVTKLWSENEAESPHYYLDDDSPCYYYAFTDGIVAEEYKKLTSEEQERFYPLICGFNPTDKYAIKHIKRMFEFYPGVFRGIGEIFLRHDDLTLLTYGQVARMDNSAMFSILEFANDYDLPILIHNNVSSTFVADHPKYLHELEIVLREFPKVKVVFCHAGISRRIYAPFYKNMVQRLLEEYPALYVDYSWIFFEEIICRNGTPDPEWIKLTEDFNEKILLGSDIVGSFHKIGVVNSKYNTFLSMLTENTRKNLCINNAERLFGSTKNKVETRQKRKYPLLEEVVIN